MSKEPLMGMDYNPQFPNLRRPCGFIGLSTMSRVTPIAKDKHMPHTPRIALDDALEPGGQIGANRASKLMSYLETVLSGDQLDDVKAIMDGQEGGNSSVAMDRAMRRHADNVKRREATDDDFYKRFPLARRLDR